MLALGNMTGLAAMLVAHCRQIGSLIDNGAPLLVADTSPEFLPLPNAGLAGPFGSEMRAELEAQRRLRRIAV